MVARSESHGCATASPHPDRFEARLLLANLRSQLFSRTDAPTIGRFRLVRKLGRGAHGVVFEAYDEQLGRCVALKVLEGAAASSRWMREARALARLHHPHVVEVYATGEVGGGVWIAMELVRGATLREWAREHAPGSSARFTEAHRWLVQAAFGLAAAHERGLLHRDVKPSNVLVGADGRARVADFGLARALHDDDDAHCEGGVAEGVDTTRTGALVGTLPYMSPEQLRGARLDPRSDQFNFAVSAWQVAYGELPFVGTTPAERLRAIEKGPPSPVRGVAVPGWFAQAVRRSLAARPDDRYASMEELVGALERPRSGRVLVLAGLGAVGVACVVASGAGQRAVPRCEPDAARDEVAALWSAERRDIVARALVSAGQVETAEARIDGAVAQFGDAWIAEYQRTCASARMADAGVGREFDERMACLRDASITVDTLLARFESPTTQLAANALGAIQSLPDPAACAVAGSREEQTPASAELRDALARIAADHLAGDDVAVVAGLEPRVIEARNAGAREALGDALELLGNAWSELNDERRYEPLMESYEIAVASGDDEGATRRATQLARQHAYAQHFDDAERWLRHADAALIRDGDDDGRRAALVHVQCLLHMRQGRAAQAIPACERARDLVEATGGPDPILRWLVGSDLALAYGVAGRRDEAETLTNELHRAMVRELGPSHPRVALLSLSLARFAVNRGDTEEAIAYTRAALDVFLRVYGAINTQTSMAYMHLACLLHRAGTPIEAEEAFVLALRAGDGRRDQWRARTLRNFAKLRSDQGRGDEAVPMLRESLDIMEELWRHDHPEIAMIQRDLGTTLLELGRYADAERELEAVLERSTDGELARDVSLTWLALARAAERTGRDAEARARYLTAIATCIATVSWRETCANAMNGVAALPSGTTAFSEARVWQAVGGNLVGRRNAASIGVRG